MTRSELIENVFNRDQDYIFKTQRQAALAVDTFFDTIGKALSEGDRAEIRDFGVFETKTHKARVGRNPKNGEAVNIPDMTLVHYKMGRELYEYLNNA